MSEKTPERLQAFRDANAPRAANSKPALVALVVGVVLGAAGAIGAVYYAGGAVNTGTSGLSAKRARELALLYENKDMPQAAIEAYGTYLQRGDVSDEERADVVYHVARLAIGAGDYEQALTYLYEAEFLDPDSEVRDERSGQIVMCLEKLGRDASLRRELKKRTGPKPDEAAEAGAVVLAEFGNETVTDRDLERKLEEMPEAARETFAAPEKRIELLKDLVAERLLLDKAFRMKLDEDEALQQRLKDMRDSMLVRELMEDEVREKVSITPQDVERFYKAETERFRQPESAQVLLAHADTEAAAATITEFNGRPLTIRKGEALRGIPNSPDVMDAVFSAEPGTTTKPVEMNGRYFVFKVESKSPERVAPFEEVKARAEQMLRAEKEQEQLALLIEETLRARNVKIYEDRVKARAP